jgi:hypothetical protein
LLIKTKIVFIKKIALDIENNSIISKTNLNNAKMKKILFLSFGVIILHLVSKSQGIINDGAKIVATSNSYIYVNNGGYTNQNAGEINNDGTIKLTGSWLNNGSNNVFTNINNIGVVEFIGSSLQEIGGSHLTHFENLTVNNSGGGVYISQDQKVEYNLTLNAGDFDLRNNNVELSTSGQVVNEADSRRLKSTDGTSDGQGSGEIYTYRDNPTGNVANLGLTLVDQISGTNLRIARGHHVQGGTGSFSGNNSVFRYYKIEAPGASNYIGKNLKWETIWTDELNGHNSNELIMYQWTKENSSGPEFWSPLPDNNSGSSVPIQQSLRSSVLDYIFVTLGSQTHPLPVELTDFTAECNNINIKLTWHTASEIASDYFTLYRSYDATDYTLIANIPAAGYSNQLLEYTYIDKPSHTPVYYKLTQTDYNGKTEELGIRSITCNRLNSENGNFDIIGSDNSNVRLELKENANTKYNIKIFDETGKIIFSKNITQSSDNEYKTINIGSLPSAIYLVSLTNLSNGKVKTKKIVIEK